VHIHLYCLSISFLLVMTDAHVSYEDLYNITAPFLCWQCLLDKRQNITTLTCHIRVNNLQTLLSYIALAYYLKLANTNYVNVDLLQRFCSSGSDKEVQRMLNKLWDTDNSNMYNWKSHLQLVGREVLANIYFKIKLNDYSVKNLVPWSTTFTYNLLNPSYNTHITITVNSDVPASLLQLSHFESEDMI